MGSRIDSMVNLVRLQALHNLPPLFWEEQPQLLAEIEEALPEHIQFLERVDNGLPLWRRGER